MSKFCNKLFKIINITYGALLFIIIGICLFGYQIRYSYKKEFQFENWQYAVLGLLCFMIVAWLVHVGSRMIKRMKHPDIVMFVLSILFGMGLVFLSYHYYFKTDWDAQVVEGTARDIALGAQIRTNYFSYCPNNIFLTFVFSIIARVGYLFGISNYYFVIILFQCMLFALTGYLLYACARRIINVQWAVTCWLMYVVLVGISPWVVIPYSDATGLIFPIAQVYLYLKMSRGEMSKLCSFLLGLICYLGYSIKPQTAIVGIAILLVVLLQQFVNKENDKKNQLQKCLLAALGILLAAGIVATGIKATHIEYDKELKMGLPHYLMLGLNLEYNGVINIDDQNFTRGIATLDERNRANLEEAGRRVREMGLAGLMELSKKKILTNFSDGTFAWWGEGEFMSEPMYDGNHILRAILSSYIYEDGEKHEYFKSYMQTLWMGTLLFAAAASFVSGYKQELEVIRLSVIGFILFELIFEARARYVFTYAPMFVLLAVIGMYGVIQLIKKK